MSPQVLASAKLYGLKISIKNFLLLFKLPLLFPLLLPIFLTPPIVFKYMKVLRDRFCDFFYNSI